MESNHPDLIVRAKPAPYMIVLLRMIVKKLDYLVSMFKDRIYFDHELIFSVPSLFDGEKIVPGPHAVSDGYSELQDDVRRILDLLTRAGGFMYGDSFLRYYMQWWDGLDKQLAERERALELELENVRTLRRAEAAEKNKMEELIDHIGKFTADPDPIAILRDLLEWKDPNLIKFLRDQGRDHSDEAIKSLEQGGTG